MNTVETSQNSVEVCIEGQRYTIKSGLAREQVESLAGHVDTVISDIRKKAPVMAPSRVAILAALNIAEELFRVRESCAEVARRTAELIRLLERRVEQDEPVSVQSDSPPFGHDVEIGVD